MAYVPFIFAVFVLAAVLLALREISLAFNSRSININFPQHALLTTGVIGSSWFAGLPGLAVSIVLSVIAVLFLALLKGTSGFISNATGGIFALIYPGFLAGFIFLLARSGDGFEYIAALVILVGCNDTFAYLVGVLIGKHPLAPNISPKKSWEGFFGGLVFASIGTALAFYYLLDQDQIIGVLAAICGVLAATIGDLVESAIKRDLALKDMGKILPGHGGMLDRLDSVLFVAPVMWCIIELLKRFG
jgi:phosphatidate cytidylyltransferase